MTYSELAATIRELFTRYMTTAIPRAQKPRDQHVSHKLDGLKWDKPDSGAGHCKSCRQGRQALIQLPFSHVGLARQR